MRKRFQTIFSYLVLVSLDRVTKLVEQNFNLFQILGHNSKNEIKLKRQFFKFLAGALIPDSLSKQNRFKKTLFIP